MKKQTKLLNNVLCLMTLFFTITLSAQVEPGTMESINQKSSKTSKSTIASKSGNNLSPLYSVTGQYFLSVDGVGSTNSSMSVQINKPSTEATVHKAFLFSVTVPYGSAITNGCVSINGSAVNWDGSIIKPAADYNNHWADVTSLVSSSIDAMPAGLSTLPITECNGNIDGNVLLVIFNENIGDDETVAILWGAQNSAGDNFNISLNDPIDPTDPESVLDMGIAISYGYQGSSQYSIIDINGTRLTTSAGGQDDGAAANGALITVGGIGDSNANPQNPNALATNTRSDDELYSLLPFIDNTTTNLTAFTQNPSNNDNIFLAYFVISGSASVATVCPEAITVDSEYGTCGATVNYVVTEGSLQTAGLPSGSVFPVGTTTNTFTNPECSFTVTVVDNELPIVITENVSVALDVNGNASIATPASKTIIYTEDFNNEIGGGNITALTDWNVISGNVDVADFITGNGSQELDLAGSQNAIIKTKNALNLSAGTYELSFDNRVNSNPRGGNSVSVSIGNVLNQVFASPNTARNEKVTFTVNQSESVFITLEQLGINDAAGSFVGNFKIAKIEDGSSLVLVSATDNCGVANVNVGKTEFDCSNLGENTVTITATDVNGNVTTSDVVVTVTDNIVPLISAPSDISVIATSANGATVNYATPVGTDNCSVTTVLTAGFADGATFPLGITEVIYTATDAAGNEATATFNVEVVGVAPEIMVPENSIVNNDAGVCGASVTYTATDTVGIPESTITYSIEPGSNFGVGTVEVTATATNAVGSSSKTFTVTVNDTENPVVSTSDVSIDLDAQGNASITAEMINNNSTDNCGIASISVDNSAFTCANLGDNEVTLTVTDVNGNSATATANVTVNDVTNPTVLTNDISLELDANGEAQITVAEIDNNSFDNCGIVSLELDNTSFSCDNLGENTVTLTAKDSSGNTTSQTATVTISDTTAPTVITQSTTVTLANGQASITTADVDGGTFDNCTYTLSLDNNSFSCDDIGENTVTLTATDSSGNTTAATATVTVVGDIPSVSINDFNAVDTQKANTIFLGFGPQSINLSTVATGGNSFTYLWTASTGEKVSNEANPSISPEVSTTYDVLVTNDYGCTTTASVYICVIDARGFKRNGKPNGKVVVCHHTNGKKGTKHVEIEISSNAVMTHLTKHGTGTDHADKLGGCNATCVDGSAARSSEFNSSSASIEDNLSIFPNPSNGIFDIKLTALNLDTNILLFDTRGKLIERKFISKEVSSENIITIGNLKLSTGIYILKIVTKNETISKKVMVSKNY